MLEGEQAGFISKGQHGGLVRGDTRTDHWVARRLGSSIVPRFSPDFIALFLVRGREIAVGRIRIEKLFKLRFIDICGGGSSFFGALNGLGPPDANEDRANADHGSQNEVITVRGYPRSPYHQIVP